MTITAARIHAPTQAPAWDDNWTARAHCAATAPDDLFAKGAAQQSAKVICQRCPVVAECLADALDNRTEYGVWGGMTERERRALLRRRPDVKSWTTLFKMARADEVAAGLDRAS